MTDQTCSDCLHWRRESWFYERFGECDQFHLDPDLDRKAYIEGFGPSAGLVTRDDFGCVLFAPTPKETL